MFLDLGVPFDDGANEDRHQEHVQNEVEGEEEHHCKDWLAAPILPMLLKLLVGGDLEANEVRLGRSHRVPDLVDGPLEGGKLYQAEKGGSEVFVALVEAVDLLAVAEEAEQLHPDDAVDEEQHGDEEEDEASARQDDGESLDDLLGGGDLIEH